VPFLAELAVTERARLGFAFLEQGYFFFGMLEKRLQAFDFRGGLIPVVAGFLSVLLFPPLCQGLAFFVNGLDFRLERFQALQAAFGLGQVSFDAVMLNLDFFFGLLLRM